MKYKRLLSSSRSSRKMRQKKTISRYDRGGYSRGPAFRNLAPVHVHTSTPGQKFQSVKPLFHLRNTLRQVCLRQVFWVPCPVLLPLLPGRSHMRICCRTAKTGPCMCYIDTFPLHCICLGPRPSSQCNASFCPERNSSRNSTPTGGASK